MEPKSDDTKTSVGKELIIEPNAEDDDDRPIEHASDIYGQWGPMQARVAIFYVLIYLVAGFHNTGIIFFVPKLNFECIRPAGQENSTTDQCWIDKNHTIPCQKWTYDKTFFRSTLIDEFDLVCDRAWLGSLAKSVYQFGYLVSSMLTGWLADRNGRMWTFRFAIIVELFGSIGQVLAIDIYSFLVARFFLGIGALGRYNCGRILIIELVGPKMRAKLKYAIETGWTIGVCLMPIVHYLIRHYRYVQLLTFSYELIFLFWLWKLPESPRWLLTNGRIDEATVLIRKAALQKKKLSDKQIDSRIKKLKQYFAKEEEQREAEVKKTFLDLFRSPTIRAYIIACYIISFFISFLYYAFSYNAGMMGGSLHVNSFVQGLAEIFVIFLLFMVAEKWPRKKFMWVFLAGMGASIYSMIPFSLMSGQAVALVTLTFTGMFCMRGFGQTYGLVRAEMFPTTLRQLGIGSCILMARLGSISAPFTKELADYLHMAILFAFYGTFSFIASACVYFLPETRNKEIPDTIEEANQIFGRKKKHPDEEGEKMKSGNLGTLLNNIT